MTYPVALLALVAGVAVVTVVARSALWCWWATVARLVAHIEEIRP